MGSRQTKIEGTYLPDNPHTLTRITPYPVRELQNPITIQTVFERSGLGAVDALDPRSPNGCRTPISVLYTRSTNTVEKQIEIRQQGTPCSILSDNRLGLLRKRFLRGFSSNLHDPRSPSSQLTRTPLIFDENDKTLNLDDTFSDLFVESKKPAETNMEQNAEVGQMQLEKPATVKINLSTEEITEIPLKSKRFSEDSSCSPIEDNGNSLETSSFCYDEEETMPSPALLQQTPNGLQHQLDPRSPTFGVDRTPIMFTDDDEASEDAMLENILATLSLDLSAGSSIASFGSPNFGKEIIDGTASQVQLMNLSIKPTNKHLDRVRISKKRMPIHKAIARSQRHRIYEDCENSLPSNATVALTPKHKLSSSPLTPLNSINISVNKRTPLSCVKNRSHLRSRSLEASAKSLKTRLSLTSFDDNLNPVQNCKVTNLRIMQGGSQDSGDLIDSSFH